MSETIEVVPPVLFPPVKRDIPALSVKEPWATLLAIGAKQVETRKWYTSYTGPIAIHASKGLSGDDLDWLDGSYEAQLALARAGIEPFQGGGKPRLSDYFTASRGKVIAIGRMVGCYQMRGDWLHPYYLQRGQRVDPPDDEICFGDWTPGRFAWVIADIKRLTVSIPATGALGLWMWRAPSSLVP